MSNDIIHDALNYLDDEMIESVYILRERKRRSRAWIRWGSLAACLCIMLALALTWNKIFLTSSGGMHYITDISMSNTPDASYEVNETLDNEDIIDKAVEDDTDKPYPESKVTIPKTELDLNSKFGAISDMLGFFIYQGRSYMQYEWIYNNTDIMGEYVGTITGLIDEWTPEDGYVELAGSVSGDFYSVKGFDPSFMLCIKFVDNSICTYINDNGITLSKGSDLYEDRIHLKDRYQAVEYQVAYDWQKSIGEPTTLTAEHMTLIERFIDAVNESPFMYSDKLSGDNNEDGIYDGELYHMFFLLDNGMTIHIRLYENGYVRFQGLMDVCVCVDSPVFDELINVLKTQ